MDRKEAMAQQFQKTSNMSFPELRKHIATHMKKSGADKHIDRMKQSKVNRAINNPR